MNDEQYKLLKSSVAKWNEWRKYNLGDEVFLADADLSDANLADADLSDANLVGANLNGANLHNANLYNADLYNADFFGAKTSFEIPVINDIHKQVYRRITSAPESFDMKEWHSECGTTHCLAGHVVLLAGKAGEELEALTNTRVAAELIYFESDPGLKHPPNFYADNKTTLEALKVLSERMV